MDELKDTVEPLLPDGEWVNIEAEAKRWDVPPSKVHRLMEEVEEEKRLQVELKIRRREQELVNYLRAAYDREVQKQTCPRCTEGPWETWGEFSAHMRMHLSMSSDEKVAVSALNAVDKLVHPVDELSLRVKTDTADRGELIARLTESLGKRLTSGKTKGEG